MLGNTHLRVSGDEIECGILHESTTSVKIDDLPAFWNVPCVGGRKLRACTATMQCGHSFHISALVLHMLTNSQQCPLCRQGVPEALDTAVLPATVRKHFERRRRAMMSEDSDTETEPVHEMLWDIAVDDDVYQRDLAVCLWAWPHDEASPPLARGVSNWQRAQQEVHAVAPVVFAQASADSVRADDDHPHSSWRQCRLQRWWKRTLFGLEERDALLRVRVGIIHPLLQHDYCTATLDARALHGSHAVCQRRATFHAESRDVARLEVTELDAVLWVDCSALRENVIAAVTAVLSSRLATEAADEEPLQSGIRTRRAP